VETAIYGSEFVAAKTKYLSLSVITLSWCLYQAKDTCLGTTKKWWTVTMTSLTSFTQHSHFIWYVKPLHPR